MKTAHAMKIYYSNSNSNKITAISASFTQHGYQRMESEAEEKGRMMKTVHAMKNYYSNSNSNESTAASSFFTYQRMESEAEEKERLERRLVNRKKVEYMLGAITDFVIGGVFPVISSHQAVLEAAHVYFYVALSYLSIRAGHWIYVVFCKARDVGNYKIRLGFTLFMLFLMIISTAQSCQNNVPSQTNCNGLLFGEIMSGIATLLLAIFHILD